MTPQANNDSQGDYTRDGGVKGKERATLIGQAQGWPTPTATPYGSNRGGAAGRAGPVRPGLSGLARSADTPSTTSCSESTGAPTARAWPTPTVQDSKNLAGPSQFFRNSHPLNAAAIVAGPPDPATPSTVGRSPDWPTPRCGRLDGAGGVETSRRLNARWVAQLMGLPSDWCELPTEALVPLAKSEPKRNSRVGRIARR